MNWPCAQAPVCGIYHWMANTGYDDERNKPEPRAMQAAPAGMRHWSQLRSAKGSCNHPIAGAGTRFGLRMRESNGHTATWSETANCRIGDKDLAWSRGHRRLPPGKTRPSPTLSLVICVTWDEACDIALSYRSALTKRSGNGSHGRWH